MFFLPTYSITPKMEGSNKKEINLYNLPKILRQHTSSQSPPKFSKSRIFLECTKCLAINEIYFQPSQGARNYRAIFFQNANFFFNIRIFRWGRNKNFNLYELSGQNKNSRNAQKFLRIRIFRVLKCFCQKCNFLNLSNLPRITRQNLKSQTAIQAYWKIFLENFPECPIFLSNMKKTPKFPEAAQTFLVQFGKPLNVNGSR